MKVPHTGDTEYLDQCSKNFVCGEEEEKSKGILLFFLVWKVLGMHQESAGKVWYKNWQCICKVPEKVPGKYLVCTSVTSLLQVALFAIKKNVIPSQVG